jgi:hypothetical protein
MYPFIRLGPYQPSPALFALAWSPMGYFFVTHHWPKFYFLGTSPEAIDLTLSRYRRSKNLVRLCWIQGLFYALPPWLAAFWVYAYDELAGLYFSYAYPKHVKRIKATLSEETLEQQKVESKRDGWAETDDGLQVHAIKKIVYSGWWPFHIHHSIDDLITFGILAGAWACSKIKWKEFHWSALRLK